MIIIGIEHVINITPKRNTIFGSRVEKKLISNIITTGIRISKTPTNDMIRFNFDKSFFCLIQFIYKYCQGKNNKSLFCQALIYYISYNISFFAFIEEYPR